MRQPTIPLFSAETHAMTDRRRIADDIAHASMAVEPGTRIGRYVVREQIGAGGMGIVLAARDPELDRIVALKLLRVRGHATPLASDAQGRRVILREAQAMARLHHPNVI